MAINTSKTKFIVFRTRGKRIDAADCNQVFIIYLSRVLCLSYSCLSSCHNCGTLCYSFSFNNQTDSGDEGEGLKREGLKMER
jgi:hypothetical protein